ncbi:ABC transporter ATP-binding protein [Pseudonocardia abyssalis]|jgi:putative ABC transport system ATP-binding protein|uniref:ABC transporter ATP-binding protein n=1 Tax=Pseudonocardia abyssalis TaxID=2792008 RepID=A0ABS6UN02_9PSEU|nr:ABC transporter ATP-binding protein [Pseudonocardia abyssalis]MBW0116537.1 ABC transporter ATP-binding protein [Pseudonocardia abyssalis]MBW0133184.1 ABC transporter ATP-binding protein [Pseudonocardia abyssalis]
MTAPELDPADAASTCPAPDGIAPALAAQSLYRFFRVGEEETLALQGVSLTVAPGEVVAVVGPSGSGKSTLLACLAGLDEPDGGTVSVGGQRISHRPEQERAQLRARTVGVLFQSDNLIEHLTLAANVTLVQQLAGRAPRRAPAELLAAVGLAGRAQARPGTLSGGEAARAGLAVALANDPAVLLADEPTGELDTATEAVVLDLMADAARRGTAVIVASHSPAVAAAAHRVITLADGRIS